MVSAVVVGALGVTLAVILATRPPAASTLVDTPLLGRAAPTLAGTGLDGAPVRLADPPGRFTLVNFFGSWCPPCHTELPELVSLSHQGVAVVGVAVSDTPAAARAFLASAGADWPAMIDNSGRVSVDWGVRLPPETFLVTPTGQVFTKWDGPVTAGGPDGVLAAVAKARAEGQ